MIITVYRDRDGAKQYRLVRLVDGAIEPVNWDDAGITRVEITTLKGVALTTEDSSIELNGTIMTITGGNVSLEPAVYPVKIVAYQPGKPRGEVWLTDIHLQVKRGT